MPHHIHRRDLPATAWTQSLAFADTATRGGRPLEHPRAWARAIWPAHLLTQAMIGHRNHFMTASRQGVISLYTAPAWGAVARAGVVLAAVLALPAVIPSLTLAVALVCCCLMLLVSASLALVVAGRNSRSARGVSCPRIPLGHVTIGVAAARPDAPTGETLLLARALIAELPAGTTVVVHPRTDELRTAYRKAGFTEGPKVPMALMRQSTSGPSV